MPHKPMIVDPKPLTIEIEKCEQYLNDPEIKPAHDAEFLALCEENLQAAFESAQNLAKQLNTWQPRSTSLATSISSIEALKTNGVHELIITIQGHRLDVERKVEDINMTEQTEEQKIRSLRLAVIKFTSRVQSDVYKRMSDNMSILMSIEEVETLGFAKPWHIFSGTSYIVFSIALLLFYLRVVSPELEDKLNAAAMQGEVLADGVARMNRSLKLITIAMEQVLELKRESECPGQVDH